MQEYGGDTSTSLPSSFGPIDAHLCIGTTSGSHRLSRTNLLRPTHACLREPTSFSSPLILSLALLCSTTHEVGDGLASTHNNTFILSLLLTFVAASTVSTSLYKPQQRSHQSNTLRVHEISFRYQQQPTPNEGDGVDTSLGSASTGD